jgi:hypothetical protein
MRLSAQRASITATHTEQVRVSLRLLSIALGRVRISVVEQLHPHRTQVDSLLAKTLGERGRIGSPPRPLERRRHDFYHNDVRPVPCDRQEQSTIRSPVIADTR